MTRKEVAGLSKLEINSVHQGDCLELMKNIADGSVDMILADLPQLYGTTACKWDTVIPFEPLWAQYKRVIKGNGAIVLTASQPFTTSLISSNMKMFKYCWVWDKVLPSGFNNAKRKPMLLHEDICIFGNGKINYYPIMWERKKVKKSTATFSESNPLSSYDGIQRTYTHSYPRTIITASNADHTNRIHPTQKPVALFEYLIKTYTNEGDLVLDNVAGSGTTGVACQNLNRNFILMEKEPEYVEIIKQRLADHNDKPARQTKLLP